MRRTVAAALFQLLLLIRAVKGFGIFGWKGAADVSQKRGNMSGRKMSTSLANGAQKQQQQQHQQLPRLVVFDLDNTLWTPELYTLRNIQRSNKIPVAGKDVKLFLGARAALDMKKEGKFANVQFAVASRTKSVDWAHDLLSQFGIRELFDHVEIFPGDKVTHFTNIAAASGISFRDMLFFDDARDGKFGNCVPVANLGVMSVHCPNGLETVNIFETALLRYSEWDGTKGTIVEWDGEVTSSKSVPTSGERQEGQVKFVNTEKRFGFIRFGDRNIKDLFFHFSSLPLGTTVQEGDKLSFTMQKDPKNGKPAATNLQIISGSGTANDKTVTVRAFSMNMPFAALLANGYKTLETRNGTMFEPYPEGTHMLLHVGQRTYPDGDRHVEVMKSGGPSRDEIEKLKALPAGFGRGTAVAICELGRTYEMTVVQRSIPEMQRKVAAYGEDSGRMVTEIKRVQYLRQPIKVAAQGGVFKVQIDPAVLPDGWTLPAVESSNGETSRPSGTWTDGKPVYSISG